jgi:hypothetical protein
VRIVLAVLVMWWVVNLIMALSSSDVLQVGFGVLYLAAVVYGLFLRGLLAGVIGWLAIGIGIELVFLYAYHVHVPALPLLIALFWSGLAILAGNLFRSE